MHINQKAGTARDACVVLAAALYVGAVLAQNLPELGYTTRVSAALIAQLAQKFGPPTPDRLARWIGFGRERKSAGAGKRLEEGVGRTADQQEEVLRSVNTFFNRVRFAEDKVHWGQDDYWATPAELIASDGGDCEDYALAKYYLLKELGVPIGRMRITYVKALKLNQAHMVLAYYATLGAEPLILDNLEENIRPASERPDLDPVYSFNDDEVELTQSGRKGVPSQLRAWLSLQERLRAQSRT